MPALKLPDPATWIAESVIQTLRLWRRRHYESYPCGAPPFRLAEVDIDALEQHVHRLAMAHAETVSMLKLAGIEFIIQPSVRLGHRAWDTLPEPGA